MPEEPTAPGPSQSVREALGLSPDADEAAVAAARARLNALFDEAEREAASAVPPDADALSIAETEVDPLAEIGEAEPPPRRKPRAKQQVQAAPRTRAQARGTAKKWAPLVTVLVVAAVVVAVQQTGRPGNPEMPDGHPDIAATESASPVAGGMGQAGGVDTAAVLEQMEILAADPENVDAMWAMADLHFEGEDYRTAAKWLEDVVARVPNDVEAYLMLGVSRFNDLDVEGAEEAWNAVLELDPERVQAHYNLGFLHLSQDPPDTEAAAAAWEHVIELAPGSDLAATVETHLNALRDGEEG
ncbi:MAG TPA: tetratricopeptide repeat protein [Actinomycetaceae bacterium]|nr:tetratricopeptide repeat protein [Actinomycetaceae bacterium]